MTKESLIWLTKEVYRLSLLFPKKEPLRYKMRELSVEILENSLRIIYPVENQRVAVEMNNHSQYLNTDPREVENRSPELAEDLEIMDSFFEVIKEQNWVPLPGILAIQREYANLREELARVKIEDSLAEVNTLPLIPLKAVPAELKKDFIIVNDERINDRQEKIMTFLREQGRAQVWQLKLILPEVTKRTLRRDFENLLKRGVIERIGERNNTFYQIKVIQA
jgi:hypothetical protein